MLADAGHEEHEGLLVLGLDLDVGLLAELLHHGVLVDGLGDAAERVVPVGGGLDREVVSGESIEDRIEIKKVLLRMENADVIGVLVVDPQRLSRGDLEDCGRLINALKWTNTLVLTPMMTYDMSNKMCLSLLLNSQHIHLKYLHHNNLHQNLYNYHSTYF